MCGGKVVDGWSETPTGLHTGEEHGTPGYHIGTCNITYSFLTCKRVPREDKAVIFSIFTPHNINVSLIHNVAVFEIKKQFSNFFV